MRGTAVDAVNHLGFNGANMAKVTNEAFNLVRNKIASVIGTPSTTIVDLGYNLTASSVAKNDNEKIRSTDLNLVIGDTDTVIIHQTGSSAGLTPLSGRNLVEQEDLDSVSPTVDVAYTNRNSVGVSQLQVETSDAYSNGTPWKVEHRYKLRLNWGSNAEFRGWANLGGLLIIGGSLAGGSGSNQDVAWSNLFTSIGNIVFSNNSAIQQGNSRTGSFPNGGLYNILLNGQQGANAGVGFKILASDANYTANSFTIYIRPYNGTSAWDCSGIEIEYALLDPHQATGQGPDLVDATLAISLNTYYSYSKRPTATSLGTTAIS